MLEDHVGHVDTKRGSHWCIVVAPEQAGLSVKPESLDAAVNRQVGSIVRLQLAIADLGPHDVGPHQLIGQCQVTPDRIAQQVDEIEATPSGAYAPAPELPARTVPSR